jgi:hypothetical protein
LGDLNGAHANVATQFNIRVTIADEYAFARRDLGVVAYQVVYHPPRRLAAAATAGTVRANVNSIDPRAVLLKQFS